MKSRSLVLLSGEGTTIPAAEARALFLAYDPRSKFESPEPRVLLADSDADLLRVGSRVAFARRVGHLVDSYGAAARLRGRRVRFRCFDLSNRGYSPDPERYLRGIEATVDLENPELELTLVHGTRDYLAVTSPGTMVQGWSRRRPRVRPFFHPSAIFPKLSRALVNMSRCREGEVFLDPFAGTGSIPLEAHLVGARTVAMDLQGRMAQGSLSNMRHFGQEWMGVLRADACATPLRKVEAVATDIPYGRASSARGRTPEELLRRLLPELRSAMAPGSYAVVMHPDDLPAKAGDGFSVAEEHQLYVHKLLTRTITVMERR